MTIDAVLFTNHAFGGYSKTPFITINGAVVSRDDVLVYDTGLTINHDVRLIATPQDLGLPSDLVAPTTVKWEDCSASNGCPP